MSELYIGLMSGTSMDGVDGVLADFSAIDDARISVLGHAHLPFDERLAAELLALNTSGSNEIHRSALAGSALARVYAGAVAALLSGAGVAAAEVAAIGAHGQTVRHRPREFDGIGYTVQLGNPSLLAELSGIDVVADFRSRDVAAGGQGAPLVPAFHRAVFRTPGKATAVLNLGGISNLTVIADDDDDANVIGFDCGPGNALMDYWCLRHTGRPFDDAGRWAAGGRVVEPMLAAMLADPYFAAAPPKSTGRDRFNADWLASFSWTATELPQDVQATLAELTAAACSNDVQRHAAASDELLICGGGAFNADLMRRLAARLPGVRVRPTDDRGLPAMQVEACAFAWLARAFCRREPGNVPSVTGATGFRLLGALHPGR